MNITLILLVVAIILLSSSIYLQLKHSGTKALSRALQQESGVMRKDNLDIQQATRLEISAVIDRLTEKQSQKFDNLSEKQISSLRSFSTEINEVNGKNQALLNNLRQEIERKLEVIRTDNENKLESMRMTVDEKLNETLDKRLSEKFKLVGSQLEQVHSGLGEMRSLASGVGDLKKVLTNVKTKGMLGETNLANLLAQILAPTQYDQQVIVKKGSKEVVDFVIKMPGASNSQKDYVLLPIDAKFPLEKYEKLVKSYEAMQESDIEQSKKELKSFIKEQSKSIAAKYIDPPKTTDFALMYLPLEGLFSEVVSDTVLVEEMRQKYKVNIAGPSTTAALLSSLQFGFRTLAIEKRSKEVWDLLALIKGEFGKFGGMLDKASQKLSQASQELENATRKTRTIEKKLDRVSDMPVLEAGDTSKTSVANDADDDIPTLDTVDTALSSGAIDKDVKGDTYSKLF
jgi:DNA recombination protein RmuC